MRLTKEEREIRDSVERGEWKPVPNMDEEIKRYQKIFQEAARKRKRLSLELSQRDADRLESKAREEGMTPSALMSSVLHKYLNGTL